MNRKGCNIALFISGHGFGHLARARNLLSAIIKRRKELGLGMVYVFTIHGDTWFSHLNSDTVKVISCVCDVGVCQVTSLEMNLEKTQQTLKKFFREQKRKVQDLKSFMTKFKIGLVLSDTAHLPFVVSHDLKIPGLCLGNFTWSDVYQYFNKGNDLEFNLLIEQVTSDYEKADLLLCLPWSSQMKPFTKKNTRNIGLIVPEKHHGTVKDWERITGCKKSSSVKDILLSFGGFNFNKLNTEHLESLSDKYRFFVSGNTHMKEVSNLIQLPRLPQGYQLVLKFCDAVITKPGYGILSDCIVEKKPLVYTSRGPFVEYRILKNWLDKKYTSVFMSNKDLTRSHFEPYLDRLLSHELKIPEISTDGSEDIIQILQEIF